MFSRIMVGAAMVLTAMAGVLAAPAQASPAAENVGIAADRYVNLGTTDPCPEGYFCAFEETNIVGRGVGFFATESNWGAIPAQYRWINNFAKSGWNNGTTGSLEDVWAYPLPNFGNSSSFPAVCVPNKWVNSNWGALRPESNRWVNNC